MNIHSQRSQSHSNIFPIVIQLVDDYLPQSQTFIYQYLSKFSAIRPVVITQNLSNELQFPLRDINLIRQPRILRRIRLGMLTRWAMDILPLTTSYADIVGGQAGTVLHAHFGQVGYRSLDLKRRTGLPLVTTFYGFDMSILPRRRSWQKAYQALFAYGDDFLVEGPRMKRELERLGCPSEKLIIQPIAIDLNRIEFKARKWDGRAPARILMAGRLTEKKGHIFAIRAFARVCSQWPSVELRIIGDGPLKHEIEMEITNHGLRSRIHLLGLQDYAGYLAEAHQAHIFMSPSVTARNGDSEGGAPTALLEMQAAGLPVLSTYHADIPYVVKDGQTGFLVPERNVEALAERLNWLLCNPESWPSMGIAGRAHITESHNIDREVHKLEDLYRELACGQA